jgi:NAD(P)H-flavin reductase
MLDFPRHAAAFPGKDRASAESRPAADLAFAFRGESYARSESESVLDALLRQGIEVPYSCRKGTCLSCLMQVTDGEAPIEAQSGLKEAWRALGYVLACQCRPAAALELDLPANNAIFTPAVVHRVERLAPAIGRVLLEPEATLLYRPGQFVNFRRPDGLMRSYSLASVPQLDPWLELHVKKLPGGEMGGWIFSRLRAGQQIEIGGPNGDCFYLPGRPEQNMLLIGNGTGLSPLLGIVRDALARGHTGEIHLYHGSRHETGLYNGDLLRDIEARHPNFIYWPCLSGGAAPEGTREGRVEDVVFRDHAGLADWRVFLAGNPPMVEKAKRLAYLAGAALDQIYADPFDLRELRRKPRS